jgi:hypothetical protein
MTLDEICHSFEPEGVLIGKCCMKRIALAAVLLAAMASPAAGGETVNGLRQAGWVVVEKRGWIERRPGLPPYETMDRAVHITTFVMEKGGQRKVCTLAYDSQLDMLDEECRDAK